MPPNVGPRRYSKKWLVIGLCSVLVVSLAVWWFFLATKASNPGILEASGRIEGDQAVVGAKIGGRIVRLPIREGQTLKANELVAELSSEQAKAQVERAEHDLHTAREELLRAQARIEALKRQVEAADTAVRLARRESEARIGEAKAALGTVRAELLKAEAERKRAERDYVRYRDLLAQDAVTRQEMDRVEAAFLAAKATEEAARKRIEQAEEGLRLTQTTLLTVELREKELAQAREILKEARAELGVARARAQSAEAVTDMAKANLKDTRVVAPFEGTVLRKLAEEGEVVAAGSPLITFVDMDKLYVKVYVPERDIGKVRIGNAARVYVDAFPERFFEAKVSEVSQQAEFTPRDIHMKDERAKLVFAVKLALGNPGGYLKPGMPADARIRWAADSPWGDGLN